MTQFTIANQSFTVSKPAGGVYVAATPIGNLGDVTIRCLETLAGCDLIACEDTRVTAKLLNRFAIKKKMVAYHEHNAASVGPKLLAAVENGSSLVLVSDAGTPLVSDPGSLLVTQALEKGLPVIPLPGASAPLSALVASGLPNDAFLFAGFVPNKSSQRISFFEKWKRVPATLIFFESPNRIAKTLVDAAEIFGGERPGAVCRELTKLHEETIRAPLQDLAKDFADKSIKGEIVLVIAPFEETNTLDAKEVLSDLLKSMSTNQAAAQAAKLTGRPKRELYALALEIRDRDE